MVDMPYNKKVHKITFTLGEDTYTSQVGRAEYVPTPVSTEVVDVGGTTHRASGDSAWNLNLTVNQDWSATGLSTYLLANEGEEAEVTVERPDATFTSTVTLVAPSIGGDPNTLVQSQIALPSTKPARAEPTP
ncbi:hypothetical protein ACWGR3_30930 [Streptomyces albidoflavus]